jgi:hypothetical protein
VAGAGFDTLDGLIRRDRRWLPSLLDYVNYTPNPALQVEAAKIAAILVDRVPHFPDLLMQPLGSGALASHLQNDASSLPAGGSLGLLPYSDLRLSCVSAVVAQAPMSTVDRIHRGTLHEMLRSSL